MSLARIGSGLATDWMGRRKPLVLFGYAVSAFNKVLFPLAGSLAVVLAARTIDRIGKGFRDAPRDAFMTDVTPARVRGSGFGLRLTFYTTGYVIGPLAAMGLMAGSGGSFRLVFWMAIIPAVLAIIIFLYGIEESAPKGACGTALAVYARGCGIFRPAFLVDNCDRRSARACAIHAKLFDLESARHRARRDLCAGRFDCHASRLLGGSISIRHTCRPPQSRTAVDDGRLCAYRRRRGAFCSHRFLARRDRRVSVGIADGHYPRAAVRIGRRCGARYLAGHSIRHL